MILKKLDSFHILNRLHSEPAGFMVLIYEAEKNSLLPENLRFLQSQLAMIKKML